MPRLKNFAPKYRRHKASGQAVVTIQGKDHYLGPWGTRTSKREYDRLIGEWLAAGRPEQARQARELTIAELLAAYNSHAQRHYRKIGKPSREYLCVRAVLRRIRRLYGNTLASEFGPLALKSLRQQMIDDGLARSTINMNVARIKRMYRWAASEELLPVAAYQALATVTGLQRGRTEAREPAPIPPVSDEVVDATLPHLPAVVADMVRFQRLTGCRPGEACILRPCDVDMSGDVWLYRPESHKTEHHDRDRIIAVGPKAQDILRPYLLREAKSYCFTPADSERKRRREQHEQRVTPVKYGNRPGSNRKRKPKRSAGDCYTNDSYRRAIHRACDKAFPPTDGLTEPEVKGWRSKHRWSPNQLRHAAATEIRKRYGLEAAQVALGHSNANVTQIYAERDLAKAAEIMREVG